MVARANGSGGDCAPTPVPTEIYTPGILCRTLLPKKLRAPLGARGAGPIVVTVPEPPTTGPFVLHTVSHQETVHGSRVMYLLTDGTHYFWESPSNVRRIDPPAPSGFVAVPPETPPRPAAEAKATPGPSGAVNAEQSAVLLMVYGANAAGVAFSLECETAVKFGAGKAASILEELRVRNLAYRAYEDEDQDDWCLTNAGNALAAPLYAAQAFINSLADVAKPSADAPSAETKAAQPEPEAKPDAVTPPAAGIDWRAWGRAGQESTDRRFQIALNGNYYTPSDTWTGETGGEHALLSSAQSWCSKREVVEPLTWARTGSVSAERAKLCDCSRFEVIPRPLGKYVGIDCRLSASFDLRCSVPFDTPDLAKRWCEVRACCEVLPDGGLRYRSPLPF